VGRDRSFASKTFEVKFVEMAKKSCAQSRSLSIVCLKTSHSTSPPLRTHPWWNWLRTGLTLGGIGLEQDVQ